MSKQSKKPLGKALVRSEADLDRLSQVTPDDFEATAAAATPEMEALLTARDLGDEEGAG